MMTPEKLQALLKIEANLRESDFPPQIVCETTAVCNFRCRHCHHESLQRAKGHMTDELWTKIVEEVARKSPDVEFWPTFYGEALVLGKRLFRKIRQARALGMTNIVLNSNGSYCIIGWRAAAQNTRCMGVCRVLGAHSSVSTNSGRALWFLREFVSNGILGRNFTLRSAAAKIAENRRNLRVPRCRHMTA